MEIMGTSAEIGLLGHTRARMKFHRGKAVGVAAIAQAGLMVKCEVPGMLDASTLVDKGLAMDRGSESTQHQQTPGVERLGGPNASEGPHGLPKQKAQAVGEAPGAGRAAGLGMGMHH